MLMDIEYIKNQPVNISDLMELYTDAGWSNYTKDPDKLMRAYENSAYTAFAYDGAKLVGAVRAVGDDETIVYIQDVLVHSDYRRKKIGSKLIGLVIERYRQVRQIVLLTDDTEKTADFYESAGLIRCTQLNTISYIKIN